MALPVINPALALPTPEALTSIDFDTLFRQWGDRFAVEFPQYDLARVNSDPGPRLARAFSYLRTLDRTAVNDAYRALRLALAIGANLDGLGADRGVLRLTYVPADPDAGTAAVMEPDESYRLRIWLRMQTWGLGSPYGVEYAARTVGLGDVADARCYDFPGEGRMRLVLLPNAGRTTSFAEPLARVGAYVMNRKRRPGAVWIDTVEADVIQVPIAGTLGIRRGSSPEAVVAAAQATIARYMASRRRIGALVPQSALDAAAHVADVVWAHLTPQVDTPIPPTAAAEAGAITLSTVFVDG